MLTPRPEPISGLYLSPSSCMVECGYCGRHLHDDDATDLHNCRRCEDDANAEADALVEIAGQNRQLLALMAVVRWAVRGAGERRAA